MSEVSTQTPARLPAAEDPSRVAPAPSATELAPVENAQQPTPPPQEANADLQPQPLPDGKTGDAVDKSDYEAEKAAYLARIKNPAPASLPPATTAPEASAPPPPPAAAPVQTDEGDDLNDINTTLAPDGRLSAMKIRPENAEERQLMSEWKASKKAGNTQSLSQFIVSRLAPAPATAAATEPDATNPDPAAPKTEFRTIEEVKDEVRRLTDLEYERQGAFDLEGAKAARDAANKLLLDLPTMHERINSEAATAAAAQERAWGESLGKAQAVFVDAGKAGTPLETAAAQVRAEWVASNHPLAYAADSALALYAEAASRINQAAAAAAPRNPNLSTPSPVHRPPLSPIIGGGEARTTSTPRAPDITETPLSEYEREKAAYLKRNQPNGQRSRMAVA